LLCTTTLSSKKHLAFQEYARARSPKSILLVRRLREEREGKQLLQGKHNAEERVYFLSQDTFSGESKCARVDISRKSILLFGEVIPSSCTVKKASWLARRD